jgi:hypothetical protein
MPVGIYWEVKQAMIGHKGLISKRRFFFYWSIFAVCFIIAMFFAGTGYALLIMALVFTIQPISYFWDNLGFALYGRKRFQANKDHIARARRSASLKIFASIKIITWLALALILTILTNIAEG